MSEEPRPPTDSRLLAALPREDYERLAAQLKPVELRHGESLYGTGRPVDCAHFP